jgi:hypothetical protein
MSKSQTSPRARYARLVETFIAAGKGAPGEKKGFGSSALTVEGRIFAMLSGDRFVVKLPPPRVAGLIAEGVGEAFDANRGRPMKAWLKVRPGHEAAWEPLADEAFRSAVGPDQ